MLSYLQKRQPSATQTAAGTFVPNTLIVIDPDIFNKKIRHRDEHSDQAVNSSPSSGRSGWPLPTAAFMYPLQALWFSVRNGHKSNLWHPSWLMNTLILITRCMSSFQGTVPCATPLFPQQPGLHFEVPLLAGALLACPLMVQSYGHLHMPSITLLTASTWFQAWELCAEYRR